MKQRFSLILALLAVLAVFSCGQKHTAKATVEQFLAENLNGGAPSSVSIERIDSTNFLVDSVVVRLQQATRQSALYKKGVIFAQRPQKQKLVWVVASFDNGGRQVRHTFYLTRDCQQVVAVKP